MGYNKIYVNKNNYKKKIKSDTITFKELLILCKQYKLI
jgi:hypothetical protein